jgi:hypothetical protein
MSEIQQALVVFIALCVLPACIVACLSAPWLALVAIWHALRRESVLPALKAQSKEMATVLLCVYGFVVFGLVVAAALGGGVAVVYGGLWLTTQVLAWCCS